MELNVLVTAAGSAIGQGIIKSLKLSGMECRIIAVDAQPYAVGLYRGDTGYIIPLAKEYSFIDKIVDICKKENVNLILVGTDYELLKFAENREKIEKETGARVIVSSPKVIRIANDKWLTQKFLKDNNFPSIPSTLPEDVDELIENEGFPLIIKPRISDSSKDTFVVRKEEELKRRLSLLMEKSNDNEYLQEKSGFFIQKYLEGKDEEYTSTTLTINNNCLGVMSMKRSMRYGGHTTFAVIDDYPEINCEIKKVAEKLSPLGPCNFQSRIHNGKPCIFEINCRFSGTTATCSLAGFNIVEALAKKTIGRSIGRFSFKKGTMIRYFNELFVPQAEIDKIKKKGILKSSKSEFNKI